MINAGTMYSGRARRALIYKTNSQWWGAIGGITPWANGDTPPSWTPNAGAVDTPIVYVRPSALSLAVPVASGGAVTVGSQQFNLIADANALEQEARFLYFAFRFDPTVGMPVANYRIFGIFTQLVPALGHENDQWLAPANVVSLGSLEYLSLMSLQPCGQAGCSIQVTLESR